MPGMMDPRTRPFMAPPGPVPTQQVPIAPGFRPPGLMPSPGMAAPQSGLSPLAMLGMAGMMGGKGNSSGGKSISAMDPASFNGVIEGMPGADAQKYLAGLPGQGGGFMNWLRGLF